MKNQAYIGDGVYVEITDQEITVYTSDGVERQKEIFLDPHCIKALAEILNDWIKNQ